MAGNQAPKAKTSPKTAKKSQKGSPEAVKAPTRRRKQAPGPHRLAFRKAKAAAWWLSDADAAAVRSAEDLADRLDALRRNSDPNLMGTTSSIDSWRASAVHGRFLAALEALQMTPGARPAAVDDGPDVIADLRAVVAGSGK